MSWMQNLCETFDACADAVGICSEEKDQRTMLLPVGHLLTQVDVIIRLNSNGQFQEAEKVKSSKNDKTLICIPCTEASESRSGTGAIHRPHPLFDQVEYLLTEKYLTNLDGWIAFLKEKDADSAACKALISVYQYIAKKTLEEDLKSHLKQEVNRKWFIAFSVGVDGHFEDKLWRMPELWKAWTDFYLQSGIEGTKQRGICYVTGTDSAVCTDKHPKSINRAAGNAKLISGNDKTNFTFRGRFVRLEDAVTISYEASQKAHQVLRWLISNPNCHCCASQAIVAWAIDRNIDVPDFYEDSYHIYDETPKTDDQKLIFADTATCADYAEAMNKTLCGYNAINRVKEHKRAVAVLAVDASTKGRMSVTYYRELRENEYEERLTQWHTTCKWYQPFGKRKDKSRRVSYFIGAPSFDRIALAVLGKRRSLKDEAYDKLVKNLNEQLLHSVFDGERIPRSIVLSACNRASNPLALENTDVKENRAHWQDWEAVLSTACALVKRYYHDYQKEEFCVRLETDRPDRDYLYGRLLAVADQIENAARYRQKGAGADQRATNAIRYMTAFSQQPFRTWNMLFTQLLNPYIQQLNGAGWYLSLIEDIKQRFEADAFESNLPLDGRYLLGFFAQRHELRQKNKTKATGGTENESE